MNEKHHERNKMIVDEFIRTLRFYRNTMQYNVGKNDIMRGLAIEYHLSYHTIRTIVKAYEKYISLQSI